MLCIKSLDPQDRLKLSMWSSVVLISGVNNYSGLNDAVGGVDIATVALVPTSRLPDHQDSRRELDEEASFIRHPLDDQRVRRAPSVDNTGELAGMPERAIRRVASGNMTYNVQTASDDAFLVIDERMNGSNLERVTPGRRLRPLHDAVGQDRLNSQHVDSTSFSRHRTIADSPYGASEMPIRMRSQPDIQSFRTPLRQSAGMTSKMLRIIDLLLT